MHKLSTPPPPLRASRAISSARNSCVIIYDAPLHVFVQHECYDEFFENSEFDFTEQGASDFQDDCLECEKQDYTHYR